MAITQTITSGVGSLEYVYVTGDGRENLSGNFKYSADLVVDSEDPLIDEINKFWKKFKPDNYKRKPKSLGYRPHKIRTEERDEDGEYIWEETGKISINFRTNTTYPGGGVKKIKIYDAYAKEAKLPDDVLIGNGSIGRISGAMGIYTVKPEAGVSLYLDSLQIMKLVKYKPAHGFSEVDEDEVGKGDEGYFEADIPF